MYVCKINIYKNNYRIKKNRRTVKNNIYYNATHNTTYRIKKIFKKT